METKIYFVRHAHAHVSRNDHLDGLTEKGKSSLPQLNTIFQKIHIDAIYSSPYRRAVQTIEAIATEKELPIILVDELKERVVADTFIEDFKTFARLQWSDFQYKLKSGESLEEVQQRAMEAIHKIVVQQIGKTVLIGTHGTLLSVYFNAFDKAYGHDFWESLGRPSIYLVTYSGKAIWIEKIL